MICSAFILPHSIFRLTLKTKETKTEENTKLFVAWAAFWTTVARTSPRWGLTCGGSGKIIRYPFGIVVSPVTIPVDSLSLRIFSFPASVGGRLDSHLKYLPEFTNDIEIESYDVLELEIEVGSVKLSCKRICVVVIELIDKLKPYFLAAWYSDKVCSLLRIS